MTVLTQSFLNQLIADGESETTEFKESFGDEAIETIGAFANSRGGWLMIGVKDSGQICGYQLGKKTIEDIANRIQAGTDPRLQPSLTTVSIAGFDIVAIQIVSVTGVPVSVRGRFFCRSGRTNQRMSHEEIMQRMISSTGLSWDAFVEKEATLDDLDADKIREFVESLKLKGRLSVPIQTNDNDVLRKLELLKNGFPTRAALLLFGKTPESFFASAFVKIGRFRSPTQIVDDREIHGTLIDQLNETMAWFREKFETELEITGDTQRNVYWEYPLEAAREAITNALCHRDYTSFAHSQVRLYDDRLEIWNAGTLPSTLTPESLLLEHDSIPRNRKIADALYYAGFIERWGSGTLRMAEELNKAGMPPPRFDSSTGTFRLCFSKERYSREALETLGLSERQIKAVEYVMKNKKITNAEYTELADISSRTASRELSQLKEIGIFITNDVTGRSVEYHLNPLFIFPKK